MRNSHVLDTGDKLRTRAFQIVDGRFDLRVQNPARLLLRLSGLRQAASREPDRKPALQA